MLMHQTMRWYGPNDTVSLADIRQAGCEGVVTALHQIPVGEVWPLEAITERKKLIEAAGMTWTVVESLPVSDDIKRRSGNFLVHIENYKTSLVNLGKAGIKVITYNFMPVLDWLRTDVSYTLPTGAKALYFERLAFVVFDIYLLKRPGARNDYDQSELEKADKYWLTLDDAEKERIFKNALLGLPGSDIPFTAELVLSELNKYAEIDIDLLRKHLSLFLEAVIPTAAENGLVMAIHPDDPPYPVLGLPRIVSTAEDLRFITSAVNHPANGLCFCTGSLGARPDNAIVEMLNLFADRIHFLHLRNTKRDENGNFYEANHLEGDTDMYAVIETLLEIQKRRNLSLPMRPDHGHQMLDDLKKTTYPGYSAIGRLKGLAELRGVEYAVAQIKK
ncbi:mannonate dehydratase [Gynurincola endophyticus]|uniref:mannonate dehydratase n=1 Tax=Gynurincola endophyticus TaxID=2479004 RepID=UPI00293930C5|nr:mannonate dehydratase [Gynurincola endophyticus]